MRKGRASCGEAHLHSLTHGILWQLFMPVPSLFSLIIEILGDLIVSRPLFRVVHFN